MNFSSIAAWVLTGLLMTGVCFAQAATQHTPASSHHPVKESKKAKKRHVSHKHKHHQAHHPHQQHSKAHPKPHEVPKKPLPHPVQPAVEKTVEKPADVAAAPATKVSDLLAEHHWTEEHHWHNPHLIRRSIAFASNTEHNLVTLVHTAVASLHHTAYRYGGNYFNMSRGVYEVDCSDYVDNLLKISQPMAYADLAGATHTEKPTSGDYYRFFNHLPDNTGHYWQRVDDVEALKPGDILVFHNYHGGGHVMVVMGTPTPALGNESAYFVRVSDSAASRHSDDTRPPHVSGVGIGTLLLKADPQTGQPSAYAWTVDSNWEHRVQVAMAEPVSNV